MSQERWGTRLGLILAMAGNAVGLGNFLRFPIQAIQNGGGAFLIPYLTCFLLLGIPLLWIEWAMGRYGGLRGNHNTPFILDSLQKGRVWKYVGTFGIFINITVAGYYCYIESWTLGYVYHTLRGTFLGQPLEQVQTFFDTYLSGGATWLGVSAEALFFFVLCVGLNAWVLAQGLMRGVERLALIGMPLLLVLAAFLAWKGLTLTPGEEGAVYPSSLGLDFLWYPRFETLADPKVWLAAAGQVFFTLAVGMGAIQCYASYLTETDDVALNAMAAGWTNEFVEVVLGSAILIPISIGYLGIDRVVEMTQTGGFGLAFRTMPFLFSQWGTVLGLFAGFSFFGLLFFAGITSSLAMGTPWIGFVRDELGWSRPKAAWSFAALTLLMGAPAIFFFAEGVMDEFDYWTGTVSLVVFALAETILFVCLFGKKQAWEQINQGAQLRIPRFFYYVLCYVTPAILTAVFLGSLIAPQGGDWALAWQQWTQGQGWPLDSGSILGKLSNQGLWQQYAGLTTVEEQNAWQHRYEITQYARLFLLAFFIGIALLIAWASRLRRKAQTQGI